MPIDEDKSKQKSTNAVSRRREFATRIGTALQARAEILGRSARDVSLKATGSADSIRCIIAGSMPAADRYSMLAHEVGLDPDLLLREESAEEQSNSRTAGTKSDEGMDEIISLWRRTMDRICTDLPGVDPVDIGRIAASLVRTAAIHGSKAEEGRT